MLGERNIIIIVILFVLICCLIYYFYCKSLNKGSCRVITPQCIFGALKNNSSSSCKCFIVKMPVNIGIETPIIKELYLKKDLKNILVKIREIFQKI